MNSKGYNDAANEQEINLLIMLRSVVMHWKSGVVMLVVGLILGCALGAWKDSHVYTPTEGEETMQLMELRNRYNSYLSEINSRNSGYLVNLDENGEYFYGTLVYYITAQTETDIRVVGDQCNITSTREYLEDIQSLLGVNEKIPISSLSSLLSARFDLYSANSGVVVSLGETTDKEVGYGLLTYSFAYLTEEQLDAMMNYVEQRVQEEKQSLSARYTFELERYRTTRAEYEGNVVFSAAASINTANLEATQEFRTYIKELSETQSDTIDYEAMVNYFAEKYMGRERHSSIPKFLILGAGAFVVLWGVWNVCRYLFSGCIYSVEELTDAYGLTLTGTLSGAKPKKSDQWINRIFHDPYKASTSTQYLVDSIRLLERGDVVMGVVGHSPRMDAYASKFEEVSEREIHTGNLQTNSKLLQMACERHGVMLLVSLGKTRAAELREVLEVCSFHGLRVFGVIAVKEM